MATSAQQCCRPRLVKDRPSSGARRRVGNTARSQCCYPRIDLPPGLKLTRRNRSMGIRCCTGSAQISPRKTTRRFLRLYIQLVGVDPPAAAQAMAGFFPCPSASKAFAKSHWPRRKGVVVLLRPAGARQPHRYESREISSVSS
ncbi:hypothetical protein ACP70R_011905 [Stipagrostis hirtigluma subsp. patula]